MRRVTRDVAIIGAGTAGLSARAAAVAEGASTVLIEAGPWGTTCARVGCMPSKLLLAAAASAHGVRTAGTFGIDAAEPRIDGPAVMARVQRERDRFVAGVMEDVAAIPDADKLDGFARFDGPTSLRVGDDVAVEARAVVIATGSRTTVPDAFRALGDLVLTNETVFELADLPPSLAVIGAGPLGLELAQAFSRLGVRVAVFDTGAELGGLADERVNKAAREALAAELTLHLSVEATPSRAPDGVSIAWTGAGGVQGRDTFARVLVAAGRAPRLEELDLHRAGLSLDRHGTPVFDPATMRCGDSAVFIAGDADHDRPVLHEAADEGWIAGGNAARFPDIRPGSRSAPLAIAYTAPELASVGPPLHALDAADLAIGEADLSRSGRARVMNRATGLLRIYARRSDGRVLGGAIAGPEAEHLAHLLAWSVQLGLTAKALLDLPFYHPSLEESLRGALRDLCGQLPDRPERMGMSRSPGG